MTMCARSNFGPGRPWAVGACLLVLALVAACSGGRSAAPGRVASAPAGGSVGGGSGGVAFDGHDLAFEQVLARCRATGKPAMLYFTTTWCGYCRKLERETLTSPEVGRHMAGYVNVAYGADGGVGRQLADRYGVRGFPTLVKVDGSGRQAGVFEGFDPPTAFIQRIPAP